MKILRVGTRGAERPAILDSASRPRDLSRIVGDITPEWLGSAGVEALAGVDVESLPLISGKVRIGAPIARVGKVVCVGLNYSDHAAESGMDVPKEPILFMKGGHTVQGPDDDIKIPRNSIKTDWEVELGVVIGRRALYVEPAAALDHVAGYCVCNDVSERAFQLEHGGQWDKGKNCETFGPLGPWLVTRDEVPDPQQLDMWLDVNGRRFQKGSTRTMVFGVAHLVHYISRFMPLDPGDVISTGTPPGVGLGQKPPVYLKAGDEMRVGIQGLGEQTQRVIPAQ
ncbi:MAG TPA: fumarylacetoacetate hydrolase family protein [Steroidobacteraceae bacterium]|nr:fumarylacetoacetate hydrolase family protein [Steroidobacteraceae bacterium]